MQAHHLEAAGHRVGHAQLGIEARLPGGGDGGAVELEAGALEARAAEEAGEAHGWCILRGRD